MNFWIAYAIAFVGWWTLYFFVSDRMTDARVGWINPAITICLFALVVGCPVFAAPATLPRPVTSEKDAIARAQLNVGAAGMNGMRYDLPAIPTGTGPHGFYNLFSEQNLSSLHVGFGICVATDRKGFAGGVDAQASTDTDTTSVGIRLERPLVVDLTGKLQVLETRFDRSFVERAAKNGAHFSLKTKHGTQAFRVPHWMFSALLSVADEHDFKRKAARAAQAKKAAKEERRKSYLEAHPETSERVKQAIASGTLVLAMSPEEARASWGAPDHVNRTVTMNGTHEQWIYGNTYVYFDDVVLTSWQDSR
jgi:hypothetical protein